MTDAVVRRRVVVTGVVQGVFFRDACRREAAGRVVAGWIRNRSDGAVEAVFEGPAGDVDAMVGWTRVGPRDARIDTVEVTDEPAVGLAGFSVR